MSGKIILAAGQDGDEVGLLRRVASEFGWRVSARYTSVENALQSQNIAAALLCRDAFGPGLTWREAVRRFRERLNGVRIVTCHPFAEPIEWGELFDLGTFHAIRIPLEENEVRQSLGFVWQAEQRAASLLVRKSRPLAWESPASLTYAAR